MIDAKTLYAMADSAGREAAQKCVPTPMRVGSAKSIFSSEIDASKPVYVVEDGPCGFAWVNIKPARGKFVSFLKSIGVGRSDSYYGGYTIWVSDYNQSVTRKEAYADAFAKVLTENGMRAYADSRLD